MIKSLSIVYPKNHFIQNEFVIDLKFYEQIETVFRTFFLSDKIVIMVTVSVANTISVTVNIVTYQNRSYSLVNHHPLLVNVTLLSQ